MLRLLCAVPCLLVACIWIMPLRDLIPEGGEGFILRTISAALHRFFVCSSVLTRFRSCWIMPLRGLIPGGGRLILRTISAALHRFFVCSSVLTSALDAQRCKQKRPPFTGGVIVLVCGERGIRTLVTFP